MPTPRPPQGGFGLDGARHSLDRQVTLDRQPVVVGVLDRGAPKIDGGERRHIEQVGRAEVLVALIETASLCSARCPAPALWV